MGTRVQDDDSQLTAGAHRTERDKLAELSALRQELVQSVTDQVAFAVTHLGQTPAEALVQHRAADEMDLATMPPEQVSWWHLERLVETDLAQGQAVWDKLKAAATEDLVTGMRVARAIEANPAASQPYERAQFAAIIEGLRRAMQPHDPLEDLLVQQMAEALSLHLRWQRIAVNRTELDTWERERAKREAVRWMGKVEREQWEQTEGWLPPRLSTAQAIEQAALLADRYQRSFLRLLKAFRDTRRLIGQVTVSDGGTLNVADKQVNLHP